MKSFESRSPIPTALIGIVSILLVLLAAYNTDTLPLIGDGTKYKAEFAEAAGIRPGNPVKVAGVVVGHVDAVELKGTVVEITFDVKDEWVGNESTASVELNTLLGQRYLGLDPLGDTELEEEGTIPLDRTTTPYEIVPALNKLSETVEEIDVDKLAASLDTLSATFANTPDDVKGALTGLSRLSTTISSRNDQLAQLLARANSVTSTVADRDQQVTQLIRDVNPLLAELTKRRESIHALLVGTQSLSEQLTGLVRDNRATLRPALERLARVSDVLARNRDNIDAGIKALGPYVHLFSNTVGVGRWFDAYVCGLIPPNLFETTPAGCEAS